MHEAVSCLMVLFARHTCYAVNQMLNEMIIIEFIIQCNLPFLYLYLTGFPACDKMSFKCTKRRKWLRHKPL